VRERRIRVFWASVGSHAAAREGQVNCAASQRFTRDITNGNGSRSSSNVSESEADAVEYRN